MRQHIITAIIILTITINAPAQDSWTIATHPRDTRQNWPDSVVVCDISDTSPLTNPGYRIDFWTLPTPALWKDGRGITITNSLRQARADWRNAYKDRLPPEIKAANKMYRQARRTLLNREGTPVGTNTVPDIPPAEFLVRAGELTNVNTVAQLHDLFKGVAAIQILSASASPQLSEENTQ